MLTWLLLLVGLAPVPFGANRPWAWSALCLWTGTLLVVWGWRALVTGTPPAVALGRIRGPLILFTAVCAYVALQLVPGMPSWAANPYWALPVDVLGEEPWNSISIAPAATATALMRLLAYGGVFWLFLQLSRPVPAADRVVLSLAAISGAYSAYGLLVHVTGAEMILWYGKWDHLGSVTSTFPNRNHFATFTGLGLLCGLAYLGRQLHGAAGWTRRAEVYALLTRPQAGVFVALLAVLTGFVALLLSHSRAGITFTLLALAVFAGGLWWHRVDRRRLPLALWFVLAAAVAYLWLARDRLLDRFLLLFDPGQEDYRFAAYRMVLDGIREFPWLGTGYGAFADSFRVWRRAPLDLYYETAHSTHLENVLELGIPAAAALGLAVAWLGVSCLRGFRRRRGSWIYAWAATCATLLVGLHASVDFSLQIPAVALMFAAVLGTGCAQSWGRRVDENSSAEVPMLPPRSNTTSPDRIATCSEKKSGGRT